MSDTEFVSFQLMIVNRFAVRAGAKHVFATDVSNMIDNARKIADVNGMSSKITFVKGRVEEVELPKVDIIVSEWMGFCLLSEIMLDCLLYARDKYLVPGGLMFPDKTSLYIAGIEDAERMGSKVDCKYYSWLRI
jgi:type I protein arginine methyltransferase